MLSFSLILIVLPGFLLFLKFFLGKEPFLYRLMISVLALHLLLMLVIQFDINRFYGHDIFINSHFFNDGEAYSANAWIVSNVLLEKIPDESLLYTTRGLMKVLIKPLEYAKKMQIIDVDSYQMGYITYIYSVIYAAYGYAPAFINFINIVFHILAGVVIFKICKLVFSRTTGYIAATLFLFNPTIFYYTTTKVKESIYIFAAFLLLYLLILYKGKKWYYLFPVAPVFLLVVSIKNLFFYPLLATIILYLLSLFFIKFKRLSVIFIPMIMVFLMNFSERIVQMLRFIFSSGLYQNSASSTDYGIGYSLLIFGKDYKNYSFIECFIAFVKGWYHMFFEPILTNNISLNFVLFQPVRIIWLFLCFCALLGILMSIRQKHKETILFLLFLSLMGSVLALGSGNIGTMLRHRDIITPIIFIYAGYYISMFIPDGIVLHSCNLKEANITV